VPSKAIPPARDRLQSQLLVWTVMPVLCALCARAIVSELHGPFDDAYRRYLIAELVVSLAFALLAWVVKAATPAAAACGGMVCLLLTDDTGSAPPSVIQSGFPPLVLLFVLTLAATRLGRARKESHGLAELRTGRRASQVIANLGVAGLCAAFSRAHFQLPTSPFTFLAALAALAEATADTVSSEIGQAFGGTPFMLTTLRRIPPGTDGAISLTGTLAGIVGAAIVAVIGGWSMHLSPQQSSIAFAAGICGLFFDSLLGATVERGGWIGNDLANFCSTIFSPAICLVAIRLIPSLGPHPFVEY
jgi:uncharacterized protein (TIGR00297 family)